MAIRFATEEDALEVVSALSEDRREVVREAYNEVCRGLLRMPGFTPESTNNRAQIAELMVETTKCGANGRACLGWLLEGSGFKVHLEHNKVDVKRPIGEGVEYEQYEAIITTVVLGW